MDLLFQKTDGEGGLSRTDLLVVLGVFAVLTLMLLPALARTEMDSRVFQCLNNFRQLARAMRMYGDDNADRMTVHGSGLSIPPYPIWAAGWLDWSLNSNNTNTALLTNPQISALAPYCRRDARVFKCPADRFLSSAQLLWKERVRSVSANPYAGENNTGISIVDGSYRSIRKWNELSNPSPAETWLALDEHPDSINDGSLIPPDTTRWIDLPASYHDGGAGVAFADGRAEIHRWQSSVLKFPVTYATFSSVAFPASDPDLLWLRARTPRKPGMN